MELQSYCSTSPLPASEEANVLSERGYTLQPMHELTASAAVMQLLGRLQEKCLATEKELNAMPAAPKAAKDIFQLCRGFERAFLTTIDVSIWLTFSCQVSHSIRLSRPGLVWKVAQTFCA